MTVPAQKSNFSGEKNNNQKNNSSPIVLPELGLLFGALAPCSGLLLAVSGGPDSTALLVLASRWVKTLKRKPKLTAVTVDHGLRAESKREAAAVARLAKKLGVAHRTVRWTGKKPKTGLQQAAREARYRLLIAAANKAGADCILTAHTLDDQAETVLIRMARGSGIAGLGAMRRVSALHCADRGIALVRPFLDIPKARLMATLRTLQIAFADDPSNYDPRFTRARLRGVMPDLAREGLDAGRLAALARRLRRADAAIEAVVDRAMAELATHGTAHGSVAFAADRMRQLPAEIALRILGRAIGQSGDEGPVELGKLEALMAALDAAASQNGVNAGFRRTLAGAMVTFTGESVVVERAPARRQAKQFGRGKALTKRTVGNAKRRKAR